MESVLVTGSRGFLGSEVVRNLRETRPDLEILNPGRDVLDLANLDSVREYWSTKRPTHLIHAAAFARGLGGNMDARESAFIRNEAVIRSPLLAALEQGVKSVVFCGTVAEYGFPYSELPLRESNVLKGPPHIGERYYGLAKRNAQPFLQAIDEKFGNISSHVLLTNLYGPGDRFDAEAGHVIPSMLLNFSKAKRGNLPSISLWGLPDTTRDFLYVSDAATAIVSLLGKSVEFVNVASGVETSMEEVARLIKNKVGFTGKIEWDSAKPIGIPRRSIDISLLQATLPFQARSLESGIESTLEVESWIKN